MAVRALRRGVVALVIALTAPGALFAGYLFSAHNPPEPGVPQTPRSYIVQLKDSVRDPGVAAERHAANRHARLTHVYRSAIKGYAAIMTPGEARNVARDPVVANVAADQAITTEGEFPSSAIPDRLHRIFAADTTEVACEGKGTPDPKVNANFDIDCVDDFRVDADIAVLDAAVDEVSDIDIVSRVDCVHPDNPYGDPEATYVPPPADPEDPHYKLWHPNSKLNEEHESTEYGCLENSGEPGDLSGYDDDGFDGSSHGTATGYRAAAIDNGSNTVGVAPGARIWSVKVLDPGLYPEVSLPQYFVPGNVPIAAYSFDEGSGSVVHDSIGSHDGTVDGATWSEAGKYGSALHFDGTDDLVSIADAADLDLTRSFSLEAWVRPDEESSAWQPLISKATTGENASGYLLLAQGAEPLPEGYISSAGATSGVGGEAALPEEEWSHIVLQSDLTQLRLYVDGELESTEPAIAVKATEADLEIGHTASVNGHYFEGMIDEVRIYDVPIAEHRIASDAESPVATPSPVAAYSFDEGEGGAVEDSAGGHDGEIEGATWTEEGVNGYGLRFDGSDDLVSIADAAALDLTDAFTLEAWVRPDDESGEWQPLISKATTGSNASGYTLLSNGNDVPQAYVADSGSVDGVSGQAALNPEEWAHLAVTYDGADLRLYVNGELEATESAIAAGENSAPLEIGHTESLGGRYFEGLIDEVRIYDVALSQRLVENDRDTVIDFDPDLGMANVIAGVDWVNEHADQIEVANMSLGCKLPWEGPGDEPVPQFKPCSGASGQALNAAIDATIEKGVVFVAAAGNNPVNTSVIAAPQNNPNVIVTSIVNDCDGLPSQGSEVETCLGPGAYDDIKAWNSAFGPNVRMAAPFPGGITSGATPHVTGAAAVLTSRCNPEDAEDVRLIADTLIAEGNTAGRAEGGWDDTSGDGHKESLLDVSNEEVFDPIMINTETEEGEEPGPEACKWRSRPAQSDVNSDGRSDLVVLDPGGEVNVFTGTVSGFDLANPKGSLELDPALLDGDGDYIIDVSDVTGDRYADLVAVGSEGDVYVHPGAADGTFGEGVKALDTNPPVMAGGLHEPIAVADVTGDGRADLVFEAHTWDNIFVAPGESDGTFGTPVSEIEVDSAFLDNEGHYYLGVADVTGDGYADLVSMDTAGGVYLFEGAEDGLLGAATEAASADPIMDDGEGEEPIGLGDTNGDGRADLLTLDGETLKLYLGQADGSFAEPLQPYEGELDSNLLDGAGLELVGLLDYSRDGLADLVALSEAGEIVTYEAELSYETVSFGEPVSQGGEFTSTRDSASGQEFVWEKPLLRRAGCSQSGCEWSP